MWFAKNITCVDACLSQTLPDSVVAHPSLIEMPVLEHDDCKFSSLWHTGTCYNITAKSTGSGILGQTSELWQ